MGGSKLRSIVYLSNLWALEFSLVWVILGFNGESVATTISRAPNAS